MPQNCAERRWITPCFTARRVLEKRRFAAIIANEMGGNLRITSGPAITHAGDLAALLSNLAEGDVLFIDEIHRLNANVEEILYPAMEDFGYRHNYRQGTVRQVAAA